MILRPLQPKDLKKASKIVGQNYSKKFEKTSLKEMTGMFKNYVAKPYYIVAEEKGKILGLAGYIQSWADYNVYEIFWVNVALSHQRKGIGSVLVKRILELVKKKKPSLIILTTSKPKFYAKRFKFKTLTKFKNNKHDLMFLKLGK